MLKYGCFVDSRDYYGRTPLFIAARNSQLDCLRILILHHADPWLKTKAGKLPLNVTKGGYIAKKILERAMLLSKMARMVAKGKKEDVWQNEGVKFFKHFDKKRKISV